MIRRNPHLSVRVVFIWLATSICYIMMESSSQAIEFYGLVMERCQRETGVIIDSEVDSVSLLTWQGKYFQVDRSKIQSILVYNTVDNPIRKIDSSPDLMSRLRHVYLSNLEQPDLTGWPTQFVDDLVVFYDVEGKSNLLSQDKLLAIRTPPSPGSPINVSNAKPLVFDLGSTLPQCEQQTTDTMEAVQPTRIITDKIKIREFLDRYQAGFAKLKKFQNRTRFYARPFLYSQSSKIGFSLTDSDYTEELPSGMIPLSYEWASGRPYSHQSYTAIGYRTIEWLSNVEPVFGVRSDLKLHFFNATLAGNLMSLPAGKSYMVANAGLLSDYFTSRTELDPIVVNHFNYMALTGIDYGPWSFATGVFYPMYGIGGDGYFREVLSSKPTILTRLMYTTANYRLRLQGGQTSLSYDDPKETEIRVTTIDEMQGGGPPPLDEDNALILSLDEFKLQNLFLRSGLDYDFNNEFSMGLDFLLMYGKYEETFLSTERQMKWNQFVTATSVRQQFGNYVGLGLNVNYFIRGYEATYDDDKNKTKANGASGSIVLEFVL